MNLFPDKRVKEKNMLLHGIIQGPKEPSSMQPYLMPLIDCLMRFFRGVRMCDYVSDPEGEQFMCRVKLALTTGDFPGQAKLYNGMGTGAFTACPCCYAKGERIKGCGSTIYPKTTNHPRKTHAQVLLHNHEAMLEGGDADVHGSKGDCVFRLLPYYDLVRGRTLDAMLIFTGDVTSHLLPMCAGRRTVGKLGDPRERYGWGEDLMKGLEECKTSHARAKKLATRKASMLAFKQRKTARVNTNSSIRSWKVPPQEQRASERRYKAIRGPAGLTRGALHAWHFNRWKSHDCQAYVQFLSRWHMDGLLQNELDASVLYDFLRTLQNLSNPVVDPGTIDQLATAVNETLEALFNRIPFTERCIVLHLVCHLPAQMSWWGPLWCTWMYPFERFIGYLKRKAKNRAAPEANIIQSYRIAWFARVIMCRVDDWREQANGEGEVKEDVWLDEEEVDDGITVESKTYCEQMALPRYRRTDTVDYISTARNKKFSRAQRRILRQVLGGGEGVVKRVGAVVQCVAIDGVDYRSVEEEDNRRRVGWKSYRSGIIMRGDAVNRNVDQVGRILFFTQATLMGRESELLACVEYYSQSTTDWGAITVQPTMRSTWFIRMRDIKSMVAYAPLRTPLDIEDVHRNNHWWWLNREQVVLHCRKEDIQYDDFN